MNYEDELERAWAKRSRKRTGTTAAGTGTRSSAGTHGSTRTTGSAGSQESGYTSRSTRSTSARSGQHSSYRRRKRKNAKAKKIALGVILAIVLVIAVVGIAVFAYINHQWGKLQPTEFSKSAVQNENIPLELREKMQKGYWTVAVFGVDSRDGSLGKGNQSDVIMIANLNRSTGEIKLVSVYRDTYLNINDRNTYNKINAAYASGGPEAAVKALNKNLDLNITHYATFNWKAVATVINILGGVDIDVSASEFYYINAFITETVKGTGIGSTQLTGPGLQTLDGVQAVAYGRLRLMDSDYARTERQRIVIQKAFEKVKTADLSTLNDVVGHVFEMCATNIEFGDLAGLVKDVAKYHLGETTGFPAARGETKIKIGSNKLSCVIPQTLESNVISLHNFLYGDEAYSPSSAVLEISAKIASVSGLSTEAEEVGHVATDKGYVPKSTTAAAGDSSVTTTEVNETEETTEAESELESVLESESESTTAGEFEFDPEEDDSLLENDTLFPNISDGPGGYGPNYGNETTEAPRSPADRTKPSDEGIGPGNENGSVPEATTSSSNYPGGNQTSVTVSEPTASSTLSPTDVTIPVGNMNGPASQATSAAEP